MSRAARAVLLVVLAVVVVVLLFTVVFPWVDRVFVTDPVVGTADDRPAAASAIAPTDSLDGPPDGPPASSSAGTPHPSPGTTTIRA